MTESQCLIDVVLPIELVNGNDGRGSKWFRSSTVRKKIEQLIRQLGLCRVPFDCEVQLRITRILGKRQQIWDADSIGRGNAKELVDALVACGWFHDDGPKYITACDYRQDKSQRDAGPAVRIQVTAEARQELFPALEPEDDF